MDNTDQSKGQVALLIGQQNILPQSVKQRHLEGWIIFSGLDTNKPTTGTATIKAYFATDTNKLYLWNGVSFKSVTLS